MFSIQFLLLLIILINSGFGQKFPIGQPNDSEYIECQARSRLDARTPGVLSDGRFNYSNNKRCSWMLTGNPGKPLYLQVEYFETECGWDHVYIHDGNSSDSQQIAALNGLLISNKTDPLSILPNIALQSGYGFLHFYSDMAYVLGGFSISYQLSPCISNCSGHGTCGVDGCQCSSEWYGEACQNPRCPNNCSSPRGDCHNNTLSGKYECVCRDGFQGLDCSLTLDQGVWSFVEHTTTDIWPQIGRASHKAMVIDDSMYVVGGYDFNVQTGPVSVIKYDFVGSKWTGINIRNESNGPEARYGHSLIVYPPRTQLLMFGGLINNTATNELWLMNVSSNEWIFIDHQATLGMYPDSRAEPVAGHTAHLIDELMYVFFGHSSTLGFLNMVQVCNVSNYRWQKVNTTGALVMGRYGHSSVYDSTQNIVYIYGGYLWDSNNNHKLSTQLLQFTVNTKQWFILPCSPSTSYPRFLHSAVLFNGVMWVFGGCTHNDTNVSHGAQCFSDTLLAYDTYSGQWSVLPDPLVTLSIARYGHSAVLFPDDPTQATQMYIWGGFNGMLPSDMLVYRPGICEAYTNMSACENFNNGLHCSWANQKCTNNVSYAMPSLPSSTAADCSIHKSCANCLFSWASCMWVNGTCKRVDPTIPKALVSGAAVCQDVIEDKKDTCRLYHSCYSCQLQPLCTWDSSATTPNCVYSTGSTVTASTTHSIGEVQTTDLVEISSSSASLPSLVSEDLLNTTVTPTTLIGTSSSCKVTSCVTLSDCYNCTSSGCMWCVNLQQCVEANAYVSYYPYGQCHLWTTDKTNCPKLQCSGIDTCAACQESVSCGWCSDGNGTGLGSCLVGNYSSDTYAQCPADRWHYFECPVCQCNGHAQCMGNTSQCQPCPSPYQGQHCDSCQTGFYGKPLNGGNCSACQCVGAAQGCDVTGKCFCSTQGMTGDKCNRCDKDRRYIGNPLNGTCLYELQMNYQFTFNLSKTDDKYSTNINFITKVMQTKDSIRFQLSCSKSALFNVTYKDDFDMEKLVLSEKVCANYQDEFHENDFGFASVPNASFQVYIYDFDIPIVILISFTQHPEMDLRNFFLTFFSVFFSLLTVAFALWKIKSYYSRYLQTQRQKEERKQWANRPFACISMYLVHASESDRAGIPGQQPSHEQVDSQRPSTSQASLNHEPTATYPSAPTQMLTSNMISLEPLADKHAGLYTVIMKLPTGGQDYPPPDISGIALATGLGVIEPSLQPFLQQPIPDHPSSERRQRHTWAFWRAFFFNPQSLHQQNTGPGTNQPAPAIA